MMLMMLPIVCVASMPAASMKLMMLAYGKFTSVPAASTMLMMLPVFCCFAASHDNDAHDASDCPLCCGAA